MKQQRFHLYNLQNKKSSAFKEALKQNKKTLKQKRENTQILPLLSAT